jgi:hypothetical protein
LPEDKGRLLNDLETYLRIGGFPEVVTKGIDSRNYLETLLDAILLKDVVKRHNIKSAQSLYDVAIYSLNQFAARFTYTAVKNALQVGSVPTVQNYLRYLEEAYVFFALNSFSFKVREQIKSPKKGYGIDPGMILAKTVSSSANFGRMMENAVFLELCRRGHRPNLELFYEHSPAGEVDFVVKNGVKDFELIQVCYDLTHPTTRKREQNALLAAADRLQTDRLLILSWDQEEEIKAKGRIIQVMPLWHWLLLEDPSASSRNKTPAPP